MCGLRPALDFGGFGGSFGSLFVFFALVAQLWETFLANGGTEPLEAARALIDRVEVHPTGESGDKLPLEWLAEVQIALRTLLSENRVILRNL